MSPEKDVEVDIFELDWSLLTENDRRNIINEHINYVELSRRVVGASGSYIANIRSLMLMMLLTLFMSLQKFENRTILFTIVCIQFAKTLFSRLFELGLNVKLEDAKKELALFLARKLRNYKDV